MKLNFPPPELTGDVPEEIKWQAIERVTDEVAQRAAKDIDDQITAAISMRLGHTDWKPMQMTGRLHRTIFMDGSEIMVLDGVPLMHIGPWVLRQVGPTTAKTITREFTHLKGASDHQPQ